MKKLFLLAALVIAGPALAQAPAPAGADEQSVRRFVEDFATALSSNDVAALDRLTAPDYVFVNQAGVVQNKATRFAPVKSGDLKYSAVRYDQVQVHQIGNTAIVTSRVRTTARNKGADAGGLFRSTLTLVRAGAVWRMVASQVTAITQ